MVEFESQFSKRTANKWSERAYFQQKPGLYILIRKDSEKEIIRKFADLEKDIVNSIKEGKS